MPPKIGLIYPIEKIGPRVRKVALEIGLDAELVLEGGVGETAREVAVRMERDGVDVIVSRGMNCSIIQESVQTPVVEIPVTGQDLAAALHEAKKLTDLERPRIALLAFTAVQHHVEVLAKLLDIDLRVYPVVNDLHYVRGQLRRAKEEGANIVVAGSITGNLARELGLPALLLDSGEVGLSGALLEAQKVAYARRLEKVRTRRLQAVVDISQNGVFVLDSQGVIQAINAEARRILQLDAGLEGSKAADTLPEPLLGWCGRQSAVVDEVLEINGTPLLLNADIVTEGTAVSDIIFTLQPVAAISELESKLRKSLHARGLVSQYAFKDILGISPELQSAKALARTFAATDSPILLKGETGTGKELFAQAIHRESPFASGPFVAVNCAALPPSLLESELFGHEEGAFTGARRNGKPGLFEMAHNGTIFLDEISEMDHYGQTRLLRVLQEKSTMRIGGDKYIPVTARVIAASNRNLPELVEQKQFRQDLYYRLNVLPLVIPPLRDRQGDIAFLAQKFVEQFNKKYGVSMVLAPGILARLEANPWAGNVRELSGIIERLVLLAKSGTADMARHLADDLGSPVAPVSRPAPLSLNFDDLERQRIEAALERSGGHIGRAAETLGVHRSTLQRKIRALGMHLRRTIA